MKLQVPELLLLVTLSNILTVMPGLNERFLDRENFYIAFKKLSYVTKSNTEWYNPVELAAFEATLQVRISEIVELIKRKKYFPKPIEPLPFPKKNDNKGNSQIRPYYRISIEDQLVWIALVNIIGTTVEERMPFWSFGTRLYKPIWFEDSSTSLKKPQYGSTHNSSQFLYRKWNQSWPLYRRYISITIKAMALSKNFKEEILDDEKEMELLKTQDKSAGSEVLYVSGSYWGEQEVSKLFWMGFDLKKFYPSVKSESIYSNIKEAFAERDDVEDILELIEVMLRFPINKEGWNEVELSEKVFDSKSTEVVEGIPTGLFVGGFLANAAFINIDKKVSKWIEKRRSVAIFKYVDDHVILSKNSKDLKEFLEFYERVLRNNDVGVEIQPTKLEPSKAFKIDENNDYDWSKEADLYTSLDIDYPEPLMTHTLKKMSNINDEDYELLDEEDISKNITDLEQFLVADFSETEMRKDTRMAFAAMKLCHLAKQIKPNFRLLDSTLDENIEIAKKCEKYESCKDDKKKKKFLEESLATLFEEKFEQEKKRVLVKQEKIFRLLLKAVKENPDKIKLWKRCFEFCFATGLNKIEEVFGLINTVPLHSSSKIFIKYYSLIFIQEELVKAHQQLKSGGASFWSTYVFRKALKQFENETLRDSINARIGSAEYPFVRESRMIYFVLVDFVMQQNTNIPNTLNKEFLFEPLCLSGQAYWQEKKAILPNFETFSHLSFEEFFWYILNNLPSVEKHAFWTCNIEAVNLTKPLSWSIISLFPQFIPTSLFLKIRNNIHEYKDEKLNWSERTNFINEAGILFQFFTTDFAKKKELILGYPILKQKLGMTVKGYRRLDEWIEWLHRSLEKNKRKRAWSDPRFSEWTALEIVKQIAEKLSRFTTPSIFSNDLEYYRIHQSNYLLPRQWFKDYKDDELSWEAWKKTVKRNKIEIVEKGLMIDDFRFLPLPKVWQSGYLFFLGNGYIPVIIGLSVLLLKLLDKSFEWPSSSNKISFIDELLTMGLSALESKAVSSDTRILLEAIFSKNNVDLLFGDDKIILGDNRKIESLQDFVINLQKIQTRLERHHISLIGQVPRQLTYISIDDLNLTKSKFFDKI